MDSSLAIFTGTPSTLMTFEKSPVCNTVYKVALACMKDPEKKYEDKVSALFQAWELLAAVAADAPSEDVEALTDRMYRDTLTFILRGEWPTLQPAMKTHLAVLLQRCATALVSSETSATRCKRLKGLVQEPWGHPVFTTDHDVSDESAMELCKEEQPNLLWLRLELLCESRLLDLALRLCQLCVRCLRVEGSKFLEMCRRDEVKYGSDGHQFLDLYIALLYKKKRNMDVAEEVKLLGLVKGIAFIQRLLVRVGSPSVLKVWRTSLKLAEFSSQILLASAVVQHLSDAETQNNFRQLLVEFTNIQQKLSIDIDSVLSVVRKLTSIAESSQHLYLFCEVLTEAFGDKTKPFCIELYVRGLTTDMNNLEQLKVQKDDAKTREGEIRLADGFMGLSKQLLDNLGVCRECILTAFSLDPTTEKLDRLCEMAVASGKVAEHDKDEQTVGEPPPPVCDTGQTENSEHEKKVDISCSVDSPVPPLVRPNDPLDDPFYRLADGLIQQLGNMAQGKPIDEVIEKKERTLDALVSMNGNHVTQSLNYDVLSAPNQVLDALEPLGLSRSLCDDLVVVLSSPRWQMLSWVMDWSELQELCLKYLEKGEEMRRGTTQELKFLQIDYSQFKNWHGEDTTDEPGIEKGYEKWADIDSSSLDSDSVTSNSEVDLEARWKCKGNRKDSAEKSSKKNFGLKNSRNSYTETDSDSSSARGLKRHVAQPNQRTGNRCVPFYKSDSEYEWPRKRQPSSHVFDPELDCEMSEDIGDIDMDVLRIKQGMLKQSQENKFSCGAIVAGKRVTQKLISKKQVRIRKQSQKSVVRNSVSTPRNGHIVEEAKPPSTPSNISSHFANLPTLGDIPRLPSSTQRGGSDPEVLKLLRQFRSGNCPNRSKPHISDPVTLSPDAKPNPQNFAPMLSTLNMNPRIVLTPIKDLQGKLVKSPQGLDLLANSVFDGDLRNHLSSVPGLKSLDMIRPSLPPTTVNIMLKSGTGESSGRPAVTDNGADTPEDGSSEGNGSTEGVPKPAPSQNAVTTVSSTTGDEDVSSQSNDSSSGAACVLPTSSSTLLNLQPQVQLHQLHIPNQQQLQSLVLRPSPQQTVSEENSGSRNASGTATSGMQQVQCFYKSGGKTYLATMSVPVGSVAGHTYEPQQLARLLVSGTIQQPQLQRQTAATRPATLPKFQQAFGKPGLPAAAATAPTPRPRLPGASPPVSTVRNPQPQQPSVIVSNTSATYTGVVKQHPKSQQSTPKEGLAMKLQHSLLQTALEGSSSPGQTVSSPAASATAPSILLERLTKATAVTSPSSSVVTQQQLGLTQVAKAGGMGSFPAIRLRSLPSPRPSGTILPQPAHTLPTVAAIASSTTGAPVATPPSPQLPPPTLPPPPAPTTPTSLVDQNVSSTTLEQLREFESVLERITSTSQMKERGAVSSTSGTSSDVGVPSTVTQRTPVDYVHSSFSVSPSQTAVPSPLPPPPLTPPAPQATATVTRTATTFSEQHMYVCSDGTTLRIHPTQLQTRPQTQMVQEQEPTSSPSPVSKPAPTQQTPAVVMAAYAVAQAQAQAAQPTSSVAVVPAAAASPALSLTSHGSSPTPVPSPCATPGPSPLAGASTTLVNVASTAIPAQERAPLAVTVATLGQAKAVVASTTSSQPKVATPASKPAASGKSKPSKSTSGTASSPPKAASGSSAAKPQQKPQEDEQTMQRIQAILNEYQEQLRNSPDLNNKPAPRRRSNPPASGGAAGTAGGSGTSGNSGVGHGSKRKRSTSISGQSSSSSPKAKTQAQATRTSDTISTSGTLSSVQSVVSDDVDESRAATTVSEDSTGSSLDLLTHTQRRLSQSQQVALVSPEEEDEDSPAPVAESLSAVKSQASETSTQVLSVTAPPLTTTKPVVVASGRPSATGTTALLVSSSGGGVRPVFVPLQGGRCSSLVVHGGLGGAKGGTTQIYQLRVATPGTSSGGAALVQNAGAATSHVIAKSATGVFVRQLARVTAAQQQAATQFALGQATTVKQVQLPVVAQASSSATRPSAQTVTRVKPQGQQITIQDQITSHVVNLISRQQLSFTRSEVKVTTAAVAPVESSRAQSEEYPVLSLPEVDEKTVPSSNEQEAALGLLAETEETSRETIKSDVEMKEDITSVETSVETMVNIPSPKAEQEEPPSPYVTTSLDPSPASNEASWRNSNGGEPTPEQAVPSASSDDDLGVDELVKLNACDLFPEAELFLDANPERGCGIGDESNGATTADTNLQTTSPPEASPSSPAIALDSPANSQSDSPASPGISTTMGSPAPSPGTSAALERTKKFQYLGRSNEGPRKWVPVWNNHGAMEYRKAGEASSSSSSRPSSRASSSSSGSTHRRRKKVVSVPAIVSSTAASPNQQVSPNAFSNSAKNNGVSAATSASNLVSAVPSQTVDSATKSADDEISLSTAPTSPGTQLSSLPAEIEKSPASISDIIDLPVPEDLQQQQLSAPLSPPAPHLITHKFINTYSRRSRRVDIYPFEEDEVDDDGGSSTCSSPASRRTQAFLEEEEEDKSEIVKDEKVDEVLDDVVKIEVKCEKDETQDVDTKTLRSSAKKKDTDKNSLTHSTRQRHASSKSNEMDSSSRRQRRSPTKRNSTEKPQPQQSHDEKEAPRRSSLRGHVRKGCSCCNGSPEPKKSRQSSGSSAGSNGGSRHVRCSSDSPAPCEGGKSKRR